MSATCCRRYCNHEHHIRWCRHCTKHEAKLKAKSAKYKWKVNSKGTMHIHVIHPEYIDGFSKCGLHQGRTIWTDPREQKQYDLRMKARREGWERDYDRYLNALWYQVTS